MNSIQRKANKFATTACLLAVCSSLLIACGGSSDSSDTTAGIGGTGIVSGQITGFGSIHVNGGKYNIDNSNFEVDGNPFVGQAGQDELALGMVVQIRVETDNGAFTGTALDVVYDDEIEGPIRNIRQVGSQRIGEIFGQTITFDETNTILDANGDPFFNFGSLGNDDVVEVSGFRVSTTEIAATYVRFIENLIPGATEVELRGPINTLTGTPPNETFLLDGTVITTNAATELDVPGGVLVEDLYVEVKGKIQNDSSIIADKVEEEDENFGDVDDISLQGVVSGFTSLANDFFIDSQLINASTAQLSPPSLILVDGLNIEVEGEIVGGRLIADEVEAREGKSKLRSEISEVDTISYAFFKIRYPVVMPNEVTVRIDGQTLFEDETNTPPVTVPFSLDDLMATDFVRIEGQEVGGEVVASIVKRTDGTGQALKLEGAVDSFVTDSSITILGVTYDVDPTPGTGTDFENFPDSTAFFAALNPLGGDFVEIEDDDVADGIVDEVEVE